MPPFLTSQHVHHRAAVLLLILPSIRELIFSCHKTCWTVWSASSPCLIQQETILKLRESVWPSVFKDTDLFSLEENGCFHDNNWTLMFLMLLSDWDCSGLFLSESCLCFVGFKYILNRVNLNQANTKHFIKYTVKCFHLCVVNLLLCSTRKSLKINLGWQCKEVIPLLGQTNPLGWNKNSYSHHLACFNYFCAWSCQNGWEIWFGWCL